MKMRKRKHIVRKSQPQWNCWEFPNGGFVQFDNGFLQKLVSCPSVKDYYDWSKEFAGYEQTTSSAETLELINQLIEKLQKDFERIVDGN